jgi:hypothetical protein
VTESVIRGDHYGQSNDWQNILWHASDGEKGCEEGSQKAREESCQEVCQEVCREEVGKKVVLAFS